METDMVNLKTMMAALLAGSLAVTAGGLAYARTDGRAFDPAKFQERIVQRVDKALTARPPLSTRRSRSPTSRPRPSATWPLHDKRVENRNAGKRRRPRPSIRRRSNRSAPVDEGSRRAPRFN
jgi:hypothetical protein